MENQIKEKIKNENKYKIIGYISLGILAIISFFLCINIFINRNHITPIFSIIYILLTVIFISLTVFSFFKIIKMKKEALDIYKKEMLNLLQQEINLIDCKIDNFLNPLELYELGILPLYDTAYGSFLTTYENKNNEICVFSNIGLNLKIEDNEREYAQQEIFKGQVHVLNYKTNIKGHLRILTSYRNSFFNIEYLDNVKERKYPEKKIETESSEFNNNFEVYGTDDHFAFYILNSTVIEKLIELKQKYGFYNICIKEDKIILIRKSNKMLFSENIDELLLEDFTEEKIKEEINELLYFAETFEDLINHKK